MLLLTELLFIVLLAMILFMLYQNDRRTSRNLMPVARIEEYWSGKERRQHIRFNSSLEILYREEKKPHLNNNCRTVDISEGGMKLQMDKKLPKGTILDFKVMLPSSNKSAEVEGEVVWSEDVKERDVSGKRLFNAGIKFRAIKEPSGSHLLDHIRSLSEKSDIKKG